MRVLSTCIHFSALIFRRPHLISSVLVHVLFLFLFSFNIKFSVPEVLLRREEPVPRSGGLVVIDSIPVGEFSNILLKSEDKKDVVAADKAYNGGLNASKIDNLNLSGKASKDSKKLSMKKNVQVVKKKIIEEKVVRKSPNKRHKRVVAVDESRTEKKQQKDELALILSSLEKRKKRRVAKIGDKRIEEGVRGVGDTKVASHPGPETISVVDSIRQRFINCWVIPSGAKYVERIKVAVDVTLGINGEVLGVSVVNSSAYNSDPFFRAMADSAIRAVYRCSPIIGFPRKDYKSWRKISINFDPSPMFF